MPLPPELVLENTKSWFTYVKEYNEAHTLSLSVHHMEKLKEKIGDPIIREQLKICVDAWADHKQSYETFLQENSHLNEEKESKNDWWNSVNLDKLCAMLDDREYRGMSYAYWYFKDEMMRGWIPMTKDVMTRRGWIPMTKDVMTRRGGYNKKWRMNRR
jgi:hypothetical protein